MNEVSAIPSNQWIHRKWYNREYQIIIALLLVLTFSILALTILVIPFALIKFLLLVVLLAIYIITMVILKLFAQNKLYAELYILSVIDSGIIQIPIKDIRNIIEKFINDIMDTCTIKESKNEVSYRLKKKNITIKYYHDNRKAVIISIEDNDGNNSSTIKRFKRRIDRLYDIKSNAIEL